MTRSVLTGSLVLAAGLAIAPAIVTAGGAPGKVPGGTVLQGRPAGQGGVHKGRIGQSAVEIRAVVSPPAPQPESVRPQPSGSYPIVRGVAATPASVTAASFVYTYTTPLVYGSAVSGEAVTYDPPVAYAPQVDYTTAISYARGAVYASPSLVIYDPSVNASAPAPSSPPPMPGVVEYSTGRYELRGDGVATPHVWVWIPNPPTGPPVQVSDRDDHPGPRLAQLYRWIDPGGVAHWTDRLDAVPRQYRAEAEQ
jgi:hypothetical protein